MVTMITMMMMMVMMMVMMVMKMMWAFKVRGKMGSHSGINKHHIQLGTAQNARCAKLLF